MAGAIAAGRGEADCAWQCAGAVCGEVTSDNANAPSAAQVRKLDATDSPLRFGLVPGMIIGEAKGPDHADTPLGGYCCRPVRSRAGQHALLGFRQSRSG